MQFILFPPEAQENFKRTAWSVYLSALLDSEVYIGVLIE